MRSHLMSVPALVLSSVLGRRTASQVGVMQIQMPSSLRDPVYHLLVGALSPPHTLSLTLTIFPGAYLSQLRGFGQLPDLIDPTAPNEAVRIDPITSNFDAPAHPEVFSPLTLLPPSMQLEPLINVHKQRLIAGVIKSLVAGQHHASRVQFPVDKKIFQKCLKLRALNSDTLSRVLSRYPD